MAGRRGSFAGSDVDVAFWAVGKILLLNPQISSIVVHTGSRGINFLGKRKPFFRR
jgi:hypothetical protein